MRSVPDFDFGLRQAVDAQVIEDYTVLVPVVTEGDPRPSLVEVIQKMRLGINMAAMLCFGVPKAVGWVVNSFRYIV